MSAAALVFRRSFVAPGWGYVATPEDSWTEFRAEVWEDSGSWRYRITTFGRLLDQGSRPRMLDARAACQHVFDVVEDAAR